MGARRVGRAAVAAALLFSAARAAASTVAEPIARLALEGGWDSNALFLGQGGERVGRISPELGVALRDPVGELAAAYGGDWVRYARRAPGGVWNHRATLAAKTAPERRLSFAGELRGGYAEDAIGLAQLGIFRTGERAAWTLGGSARAEWEATRRLALAATVSERLVRFTDRVGGAKHAPGAEALWAVDRRLSVGAAGALGIFQGFERGGDTLAFSYGLRARARWRANRHLELDAAAGPALWTGPGRGVVPEGSVELRVLTRGFLLRTTAWHALGIGSTARPGLVDGLEFGLARQLGLTFDVRGDGGLWRSGQAPTGAGAVLGYALSGEAGAALGGGLRLSLAMTHFARLDAPSPALRRTTAGIRLAFALPVR